MDSDKLLHYFLLANAIETEAITLEIKIALKADEYSQKSTRKIKLQRWWKENVKKTEKGRKKKRLDLKEDKRNRKCLFNKSK